MEGYTSIKVAKAKQMGAKERNPWIESNKDKVAKECGIFEEDMVKVTEITKGFKL